MARKEISGSWTRDDRNNLNDNFRELYNEYTAAGMNAAEARQKALEAVNESAKAKEIAERTSIELGQAILEGDSSPLAGQLSVGADGTIYSGGPQERLVKEHEKVTAQLAETADKLYMKDWELNSKQRRRRGFVVFRSDDGTTAEYTDALPIFQRLDVPQTIAVISDRVGTTGYLSKKQLLELQDVHGWEIMSHSKTHPIGSLGQTMIPDMTEAQARIEFRQSKKDLEDIGLVVQSYAHVGGEYRTRERKLTKEYYRAAMVSSRGSQDGWNSLPLESQELKTFWVDPAENPLKYYLANYDKNAAISLTIDRAKEVIDKANFYGGLTIIGTHFKNFGGDSDFLNMYEEIVNYAKTKTTVTTLRNTLNNIGNVVDVGDFSKASTGDRLATGGHFVVGADGTVSGGLNIADYQDKYSPDINWDELPIGITVCNISGNLASQTNTPNGKAGTIMFHKTSVVQTGYNMQQYREYRSGILYARYVQSDGSMSNWEYFGARDVTFVDNNTRKISEGVDKFRLGISYTKILSSDPEINLAPNERPGLLITHKISPITHLSLNYQEYHLNFDRSVLSIYKRVAIDNFTWSNWVKIAG